VHRSALGKGKNETGGMKEVIGIGGLQATRTTTRLNRS